MNRSNALRILIGAALLFAAGCGGDDAAGKGMKASGGGQDEATKVALENMNKPVDKNDPNFQKMATPEKRNTARDKGVSSGGATSSAILD